VLVLALTGLALAAPRAASGAQAAPTSSSSILLELRSFREMGSVLYIAAHPDDENTLSSLILPGGGAIGRVICR